MIAAWFPAMPALLSAVGSFLLGIGIGIPFTYFFSFLFTATDNPIVGGAVATVVLASIAVVFLKRKSSAGRFDISSVALALGSLLFSGWMMTKTFHGNGAGELFVGSNNVFDFGLSVGLMRSISWGINIPLTSPFFAGLPLFYHFFFNVWTALWETLGAPAVWAINIPSILSFTAFLVVVYYLPQVLAKQKPWVGWIAVFLTLTNSSLAFWHLLIQHGISLAFVRTLWMLPTYPFAGPFDGSVISLFITLNNYVNQRHLAFAIALGLFLYISAVRAKKKMTPAFALMLGIFTGALLLWNMSIYAAVGGCVLFALLLRRQWREVLVYAGASVGVGFALLIPILPFLYRAFLFVQLLVNSLPSVPSVSRWTLPLYLWENLGILPVAAAAGYGLLDKEARKAYMPHVLGFVAVCVLAGVGNRGFDQKWFSFFIIGMNALAACGAYWLWRKRGMVRKGMAIVVLGVLSFSGIVNLFPLKNEFAFPLISSQMVPVVSWIKNNTPKDAVFVSYSDMIDPVVLAGRRNYFGFFGNIGYYDRSEEVREVYSGNADVAGANGISYILVPKWEKNDFSYEANPEALRESFAQVYEDERYLIFNLVK